MNKKLIMLALAVMVSAGQTYASTPEQKAAALERQREAAIKNAQKNAQVQAAQNAQQANQRRNQARRWARG